MEKKGSKSTVGVKPTIISAKRAYKTNGMSPVLQVLRQSFFKKIEVTFLLAVLHCAHCANSDYQFNHKCHKRATRGLSSLPALSL